MPPDVRRRLAAAGKNPEQYRYLPLDAIVIQRDGAEQIAAWWAARRQEIRAEAMRPEHVERRAINDLYRQAERWLDGDYHDPDRGYHALAEADRRLAAWRRAYPAAAAAEAAADRQERAEHLRDLAAGALLYDADGSLSASDQQRRHDELLTQAAKIEGGKS